MNKKLLLFLCILSISVLTILYFLKPDFYKQQAWLKPGQIHQVILKPAGFSPQVSTVSQGDIIDFSSMDGVQFWPASDLHPTHGIYPEFDPQEPIEASSSWQFQFNKKGSWKFHDHLNPFFRGTIIVE